MSNTLANAAFRPNVWMLIFDISSQDNVNENIQTFIENHRQILAWWNYVPGSYLLQFPQDEFDLQTDILKEFPSLTFLYAPLAMEGRVQGNLPLDAWAWLFDLDEEAADEFITVALEYRKKK